MGKVFVEVSVGIDIGLRALEALRTIALTIEPPLGRQETNADRLNTIRLVVEQEVREVRRMADEATAKQPEG